MTENEMVGWHHLRNGYEFEQTLGDSVQFKSTDKAQKMRKGTMLTLFSVSSLMKRKGIK